MAIGLAEREPEANSRVLLGRRAAIGLNMRMQSPDSPQSRSIGTSPLSSSGWAASSLNKGDPVMEIQEPSLSTTAPKARATLSAELASAQREFARSRLRPAANTAQAIARWVRLLEGGASMLPARVAFSRITVIGCEVSFLV
jgi:hypothetical protein